MERGSTLDRHLRNVPEANRARSAAPKSKPGLSTTSWLPDDELGFRDWVEQGRRLGIVGRGVAWWIGDWLRYGNEKFGQRYTRAARITGYDVQTLMNMVYVASAYDASARHQNLTWSHHAEIAALGPEERERWLSFAETNRLSVRCLRQEVRRAQRAAEIEPSACAETSRADMTCPACGCLLDDAVLKR